MRARLKDSHPIFAKLDQLFDKMEELGIELWHDPYRGFIVKHEKEEYELLDLEDEDNRSSLTLPPSMEWKLCREATAEEYEKFKKTKYCECCGTVPVPHECPGPMF